MEVEIENEVPYEEAFFEGEPNKTALVRMGYTRSKFFSAPHYDSAIIGIDSLDRVVYDYNKMVEHLVDNDGMTPEEAIDFIDYNPVRSVPYWHGEPIIFHPLEDYI